MRSGQTDAGAAARTGIDWSTRGLRCRAMLGTVSVAALLALLVLGLLHDAREPPASRWPGRLREADAALRAGDLYSARSLYAQTARIASWSDDWAGLLAAACGLKRIEKKRGDYFATRRALVRAMLAAGNQRSASGLSAVAEAFAAIGEHNIAATVRGRIPPASVPGDASPGAPASWNCG